MLAAPKAAKGSTITAHLLRHPTARCFRPMCRTLAVSCRLCLASNLTPPYVSLPDDAALAEAFGTALALQTTLQDDALYPNHVCSPCRDILLPFLQLQQLAIQHERFILKYQSDIKQFGLNSVKVIVDSNERTPETMENGTEFEDEVADDDEKAEGSSCVPPQVLKKSKLTRHQKVAHKSKDIDCEVPECKVKFSKKSDMKKHIRNVHNNEKSLCVQCGDSFKDLNYHIRSFHDNIQHPCNICSKSYTTKQGLSFHLKHSHGDVKKEVCHICAVEVKHVRHHIKMKHSGTVEKNIPCHDESCERKFRTKQEATIHYNSAHLNKKDMCPLCGGWFKSLYTHVHQTHQSEKKHVCDQCGKAFGKKNDLKVHKDRIHLLKRYICPECGKSISKIREHLKIVHSLTGPVNLEELEDSKFKLAGSSLEAPIAGKPLEAPIAGRPLGTSSQTEGAKGEAANLVAQVPSPSWTLSPLQPHKS